MPAVRPLRFIGWPIVAFVWGLGGGSRDPCALKTLWVYCREQPGNVTVYSALKYKDAPPTPPPARDVTPCAFLRRKG